MKFGIAAKINLLYLCIIIVFTLLLGFYFIRHEKRILDFELDERANSLLNNLSINSEYPVLIKDYDAISKLVKGVMAQKDIVFCKIVNKDGIILVQEGSKEGKLIREISSAIATGEIPKEMEDELLLGGLKETKEEIGKIYLAVSLLGLNRKLTDIRRTITIVTIITIISAFFFSFLFLHFILGRPIDKIVIGTKKIAGGDLSYRIEVKSQDEIGYLASSFNKMMEGLQKITISKDYLNNIIKNITDVLIVTDENHIIKTINKTTKNLLEYEEKEILNKPLKMLFPDDDTYEKSTEEIIEYSNREIYLIKKNGESLPVLFNSSIFRDNYGKTAYLIYTAKDITRLKKAEDELKEYAEKVEKINMELDDFTYIVSHDLKEPLRSINAFSKFVINDYKDKLEEEGKNYLERIRANAGIMQRLIEDLLEVSRLERRKNPFEDADTGNMLNEIKIRMEHSLTEKKVEMVINDKMPVVFCDRVRLTEVFANLISNAVKYADKIPPRVDVGYKDIGDYYKFYVKDNGPGIPEKYYEKIFKIFQRLIKKEEKEGTGVGLTIAEKIVEMHKGKIWVESIMGEGSTFYFTIPKSKNIILGKKKIGEILIEKKIVDENTIKKVLEEQKKRRHDMENTKIVDIPYEDNNE